MPLSGLNFLIVEDHPLQLRMMARLLGSLGAAQVHLAGNGHEALQVLRDRARPVDLVLSDVEMPGMDAHDLVRELGAAGDSIAGRPGLILVSAIEPDALGAVARMALAYDVNIIGVMHKPATAAKLVPFVRYWRERRSAPADGRYSMADLAQAWERGEFEPAWLPRVELAGARVIGLHAQPRWRHPAHGLLEPPAFMNAIDGFGLRDDLAWRMVESVLAQSRAWGREGTVRQVSMSLAFGSLAEPGLVDRLQWLLRKTDANPAGIAFGIPVAALAERPAASLNALERLRALGFGLAVQDYSPNGPWLEYLDKVRFEQFWIGGKVVRGAREDESVQAGLFVALEVAQQHRLLTVGRGISGLDDWNRLQDWGCRQGEGPFIAAGLAASEVAGWLADRDHRARAHGAMGAELDLGLPPEHGRSRPPG